jgi:uncharacterized protein YndB with AHSA1/START domain/predicted enzyme related to lactoylglutathione lyase
MTASAKATVTTPSDRTIRIERIFAAPRERVWAAMTDPAQLAQWWGRGNQLTVERLELRRGGHWRFVEHTPDGARHGFEGRYREVVPPQRIVQTFEWDGMPGHVVINETDLEDLGDGRTRLIVVSLFSSREERDGMRQSGMEDGMNQSYRTLDRLLDGTAPPPRPGVVGMVKKVAFTMYPIQDAARARKFYEETLGLSVGMAGGHGDMHWIEYDLPGGGCLALTNTTGAQPSAAAGGTIALEVADLPALVGRLKSLGVAFKAEGIRGPHCQMAVCLDSEGNSLLLHQLDAA